MRVFALRGRRRGSSNGIHAGSTMRISRPITVAFSATIWLHVLLLVASPDGAIVRAAEPTADDVAFFERRIRPLLVERCVDCHSRENAESGLSVESRADLLGGGMRGPAIVPGDADASLLVRALRHGEALKMPAREKLEPQQIRDVVRWIEHGAAWPQGEDPGEAPAARTTPDTEPDWSADDREFWSFQPVQAPAIPLSQLTADSRSRLQSPLDAFVLRKLEAAGLTLAPPADRRTLVRRLTLDLLGIPPTPAEVRAFVQDERPDAIARLVDRLLTSPLYGQRWGRHWLDVARYADSNGLDENLCYGNAYRYRNYVIDAFNRDLDFNQFLKEQIAGDLIPGGPDTSSQAARITATGFLCLGPKMLAEDDPVKMQMDIIDEQLDTIGRAFMGLTLGCARCHHHKFDPVSMHDYYGLAGILKSTRTMENFRVVARWQERPVASQAELARRAALQQQIDARAEQIEQVRQTESTVLLDEARRHADDYLLAVWRQRRNDRALAEAVPLGDSVMRTEADADQTPAADDDGDQAGARPAAGTALQLLEAENFVEGNVRKDFDSYGAGIGVLVNQGQVPNRVAYEVTLPRAGLYRIELRYAAAEARPCQLFVNGRLVKSDAAGGVTGSWQPEGQQWEIQGLFAFQAGGNRVRLEHPQFFPHIDKLLIAPAPDAVSDPVEPFDSEYRLIPTLVTQWSAYLKSLESMESAESPSGLTDVQGLAAWPLLHGADVRTFRRWAREIGERVRRGLPASDDEPVPSDTAADPAETLWKLVSAPDGPFAASEALEADFAESAQAQLAQLRAERDALQKQMPELPVAMAVSDQEPEDLRLHYRGNHLTLGPVIPRRLLGVLVPAPELQLETGSSGRRELAEWLASDTHPLTPRVIVNRVWLWHFGEGLVRSPDNFGRLGERPTHPELLDWLTARFLRSGWSLKQLHRDILLSSTWQQSSAYNARAAELDPENRLLWRMPRRRLEAEVVRDSLLAVAGNLDRAPGDSLLTIANRKYVTGTANVDPVVYDSNLRSVYLPVVRSAVYDVLQAFDFADPSMLTGQRQTTTVAAQALFMMNSQFVEEQTRSLAQRLLSRNVPAEDAEPQTRRVQHLWRLALNRLPTDGELEQARRYLSAYAARLNDAGEPLSAEEKHLRAWQSLCRAVLSSNEFMFVD